MNLRLLFLCFCTASFAQQATRSFVSQKWNKNALEIQTTDGIYRITPYSANIFETTFLPKGESSSIPSHAIVMQPTAIKTKLTNTTNEVRLRSAGMEVRIQKAPFQLQYWYHNKLLLTEKNGYTKRDSSFVLDFAISANEALYGGGSRALGLNRRGNKLELKNQPRYGYSNRAETLNFCIPLVLSSQLYAVHFDNSALGFLDLDSQKNNTIAYESASGRKTYQVIAADSWTALTENYTQLTGLQPLPPRWAFGNFASRFGYHSQEETEKTIQKFQDDHIPVDAIILDLYWFGKTIQGTLGNLSWDKETFPNPEKMMKSFQDKGIQTVLITEPFVLSTSSKWKEAEEKGILATEASGKTCTYDFYFGHTGIIDVFKPQAKQWFWDIYKGLIAQGATGLWGDLGEPESFPSKAITAAGKASVVHNIYGHHWAKLIAEGYQRDFPSQRPFILMRSGYSGSQHFGIIPWSGDVSRSWEGLQSQPEIALGMGMQGIGYMHSDLGGFAGDYFDNNLYLRWLQYGVFQPIFRPHAHEAVASEVAYKDVDTKAKAKKLVELRYQMLPYNYTLAFENSQKGTPLMRPLLFEEPQNSALWNTTSTYLWGPNFLVTPITQPNTKTTTVYFPKANSWYDWYSNERIAGGTQQEVTVADDHLPVYVRGGSFIPMINTIQTTGDYSLDQLYVHYYHDEATPTSFGNVYNDDGKTPNAFATGAYERLHFSQTTSADLIEFKLSTETGKAFVSAPKKVNLILHHFTRSVTQVMANGKAIPYVRSKDQTQLIIPLTGFKNPITLQIR